MALTIAADTLDTKGLARLLDFAAHAAGPACMHASTCQLVRCVSCICAMSTEACKAGLSLALTKEVSLLC